MKGESPGEFKKSDYVVSIHTFSDRKEYYWALVHFNEKQKTDKMVEFLDNQTYITWIKDYDLKLRSF